MNRKQITKFVPMFIRKTVGDNDIKIVFFDDKTVDYAGTVYPSKNEIRFNFHHLRGRSRGMIQATVLHELGHLDENSKLSRSMREFMASTWALRKAEQMGLSEAISDIRQTFRYWYGFKWSGESYIGFPSRAYLLAARMAKREHVI